LDNLIQKDLGGRFHYLTGLTQLIFLYPRSETIIPEYIRYAKTLVRYFPVVPHVVFSDHFNPQMPPGKIAKRLIGTWQFISYLQLLHKH
jgi:hypothetical protein